MEPDRRELQRLIAVGLQAAREEPVLDAVAESLIELGTSVRRIVVASDLLHPLFGARGVIWTPKKSATVEDYDRGSDETDSWLQSPFYHMLNHELPEFRVPFDTSYERERFPILDRLKDEGATDYVAMMTNFGSKSTLGDLDGLIWSFTTAAEGGFKDTELDSIRSLVPAASLAFKAVNTNRTGRTLMSTYLGEDAGHRVVSGAIDRGSTETVKAALWYSDLEGFTKLADVLPQDDIIALLNEYADCIVTIIHAHHGQVLKFMGDGILAMFPFAEDRQASVHALDAASELLPAIEALNVDRRRRQLATTKVFLGLHVGKVLYGNVGSRERLDFTVVGPAVNEVARIEQLSRSVGQNIAVSQAFANFADSERERLVSLGKYMFKGVSRPEELFTLDPDKLAKGSGFGGDAELRALLNLGSGDALVT